VRNITRLPRVLQRPTSYQKHADRLRDDDTYYDANPDGEPAQAQLFDC